MSAPVDPVNILDLCTGTGCIPLLLHHDLFRQRDFAHVPNVGHIVGVDVSPRALELAEDNKAVQLHEQAVRRRSNSTKLDTLRDMRFIQADILANQGSSSSVASKLRDINPTEPSYDILISNPPYISSTAFRTTTAASVRRYEPKLALVPPIPSQDQTIEDGDAFYPELYKIARQVKSKVVLFEVADMEQACRVAAMADEHWDTVEIWRDDPGTSAWDYVEIGREGRLWIKVRGTGNGRSVVAYSAEGSEWLGHGR